MYQKMWFVETAGSEQTSSAIMLWAKTRVYVCSGRAGGNERHLLFYARYEETWSLFLINIHPPLGPPPTPEKSLCFLMSNAPGLHFDCKFTCHSRQPRRNRCVSTCKMRLGFILTVNLFATPANPGKILAFSHVKCACQPRRNSVFSHVKCAGVMRMHSLVDFSAFQRSFCSHESRGTTKWPGMSVHNYTRWM